MEPPLYDATGIVIERAIARNNDRTVIVILTDGHENASVEYTQAKIKDKVKQLQDKGWEVIFLGANFDVATYTTGAGLDSTKFRNVDFKSVEARAQLYNDLSVSTAAYSRTGASINMSVPTSTEKKD